MNLGPIPKKMSYDGLSQILNGLGAIGVYKAMSDHDYISGLFGIACIGLAIILLYFRNRWNEGRPRDQ